MDRDIRQSKAFRRAEDYYRQCMEPGFGSVTEAMEPSVRPDGAAVAVTGTVYEKLEGSGHTRIAVADDQGLSVVTGGPGNDKCPRWSPDGQVLAFLSDRNETGVFGLYLLRPETGEVVTTPFVDGTVEYYSWSRDGRTVLLGVAGIGADQAGGNGSGTVTKAGARSGAVPSRTPADSATTTGPDPAAAWLPEVRGEVAEHAWRSLWRYDVDADEVRPISPTGMNVWEAAWLGPNRVAAVVSPEPGEDAWYTGELSVIDVATGSEQVIYKPQAQLGWPAGSPTGHRLAVVEACCSDRWVVAGELRLIDPVTGSVQTVDTGGVDVTGLAWIDQRRLGYVGIRDLQTVVGWYDTEAETRTELLSTDKTSGNRYPEAAFAADGSVALILESYDQPQAITLVSQGGTRELASLAHPGTDWLRSIAGTSRPFTWSAPDGMEIEGILCQPSGKGPFPLVVQVHGGPVWSLTDRWMMRYGYTPLLVSNGYAVLHPNPRGSSGRGQRFAREVLGDMGGADTLDILTGIDALVDRGIADPNRVGVMGGSYGGYMSSWIITQDQRFAAAVPMFPTTNWYSQHHTSNIGYFDDLFLDDSPYAVVGKHHSRSPVMYARRVRTPTLLIAGARDRCTPPGQAVEYHNALLENGVETSLVIYSEEGHGVRTFPARIDLLARILCWFQRHMSPGPSVRVVMDDLSAKDGRPRWAQ